MKKSTKSTLLEARKFQKIAGLLKEDDNRKQIKYLKGELFDVVSELEYLDKMFDRVDEDTPEFKRMEKREEELWDELEELHKEIKALGGTID